MSRRLFLTSAFFFATLGLLLVVTDGFVGTVLGMRVSARSPGPSLLAAIVCVGAWLAAARRANSVAHDLVDADAWITARCRVLVAIVAALAAVLATRFNSFSAAGADASGYLSFAAMLQDGHLMREEILAPIAKWTAGPTTLAPLGWREALVDGMQVPTYAPGLPALMAPLHALGGVTLASLLMPLSLALAVYATAAIAFRVRGPFAALIAAVWMATSPVALIHAMQVMSDVPVTAAWLVCWWLAFHDRPLASGVAAAVAILIRPNLAPVAIVPASYLLSRAHIVSASHRWAAFARWTVPAALAIAVVAYLQWLYFGSPLRSGYGTAQEIYALSNVAPNAAVYARWLWQTHGPWLFATPLALMLKQGEVVALLAFGALVVMAYLIYGVFETWTYLRFMLPALAVATICVSALIAKGLQQVSASLRVPLIAAMVLALAASNISAARSHDVFRSAARQARARVVGQRLADTVAVNTVIMAGEQSGAMRYYTGRSILRWDLLEPEALPDALDWLTVNGYQVWVVLDDWEEEAFRGKFPSFAPLSIDQEPMVESAAGVGIRTRAWRARALAARSSKSE